MLTKAEHASPKGTTPQLSHSRVLKIIFASQIAATAALNSEADCIFLVSFVQGA